MVQVFVLVIRGYRRNIKMRMKIITKTEKVFQNPLQITQSRLRNREGRLTENDYPQRHLPIDISTDTTEGRNKPDIVGRADI